MIGKTISHYKILSKLGEGGMGVVYKAEDLTLGRTVALKFLPPDSIAREADRARLVHEARAAAALLHPNICPIHEIAEAEGRTFISMAYIGGRSLKDRIVEGALPLEEALSITRQIGDALASAHAKGIIHRDIKPANVMLTAEGRPMLMDFGLAKVSGATKLTRTGTTMGTVAYMSPEQVQGKQADHRSDIWALGVVLYEMISGKLPFAADYEAALLYSILNEDPEQLAKEGGDIPAGLDGIIAKALTKDPARRYKKAEELIADLDALARDREALPAGKAMPARGLKRIWRRWRPRQRAAAITLLVTLAAIGSTLIIRFGTMAPEAGQYSLAVMDFRDMTSGSDSTLSAQIAELVNTSLIQSLIQADVIRVVSKDLLQDLRRRLYGSPRGAIDQGQTFDLARQAEATLYLVGTIGQAGSNQFADWKLVDARNGKYVGYGRAEGAMLTIIADQIVEGALPRIARACGIKSTSAPTSVESITTENPRAYLHYMAGLLAKEEGRAKDAIAEMEKAIGLDSTFALAYYEVSRLTYSFRPGASDQSWAYAEKARNLKSKLSTRDQMRVEAWWADTPARQIEILKEARKRWPDDRQVLIDLINRLSSWWKYHEALQVAEEGQRLYPDEPIFNGPDYSGSLIHAGRAEDALRAARSWASKHPAESDNFKAMANRFLALGMPDSAEVAFNRAIAIDPKLCPEMQGYLAYQRGELKDAIAIFENILEREDLSADERFNLTYWCAFEPCLASLYVEAGRYKRVRNLIGDQITSSFINPPIFRLFIAIRRAKEVRDMIVDNAMGPPINSYRPLGRALAMLGDAKGAREVARQYMGTENDWGTIARYDALEIRVWAALAEGDPTSALELLGQMRDLVVFPFGFIDIDYWTALGMAYRMDGRLEKAVEVHKEMLKIHGGHALSHYELGTLYEEMKRPAEAKKEYAKFLEMWSEADEDLPQLIDARKRLASL